MAAEESSKIRTKVANGFDNIEVIVDFAGTISDAWWDKEAGLGRTKE